jgi:hypothetical protein
VDHVNAIAKNQLKPDLDATARTPNPSRRSMTTGLHP